MKKTLAVLVSLLVASATAFWLIPPPKKAHAQLSAVQTWVGQAGGTTNAITMTIHNVVSLNDLIGVPIRFLPSGISLGTTTLQVNLDGGGNLGAVALLRPTTNIGLQPPSGSELQTNTLAEVTYDGAEFVVTSAVDMTPVGQSIDLRTQSAMPGYLIEDGSCQIRTTYPALFVAIGTVYNSISAGGTCSGSQFAVPYANGTASVAQDNQGTNTANRITSAGSGCNAVGIGILCGNQNQTLTASQIPTISSTNSGITLNNGSPSVFVNTASGTAGNASIQGNSSGANLSQTTSQQVFTAVTVATQGGSTSNNTGGAAHPIIQPLLTVRKAIKA